MTLAIEMHHVTKRFTHFTLSDVNLQLPSGTVMGLIGPNAAGKSTTLQILMGMLQPDEGSVRLLGCLVPEEIAVAKRSVAYVSSTMRLHEKATLAWHMRLLKGMFAEWDDKYATFLLGRFGLIPEQRMRELSQGEQMKALLLLAFARRPKLLVLDEPTTGLDPVARHEVNCELMRVVEDDGRTILLSSHNVADVEQFCDSIMFLDRGHVIASESCETYLDRWKRLRLNISETADLPPLPQLCVEHRSRHQCVAVVPNYDIELEATLVARGFNIASVERMTLEEIFVNSVMMGREARGL